jgi:hypothetical protein
MPSSEPMPPPPLTWLARFTSRFDAVPSVSPESHAGPPRCRGLATVIGSSMCYLTNTAAGGYALLVHTHRFYRVGLLTAIPRLEAPYFHIAVRKVDWGNRLLQFYCVNRSILLYSREICCRPFRHHRHHPSEPHRRPFTRFTQTCTRRAGRRARARGGGLPGAVAINK